MPTSNASCQKIRLQTILSSLAADRARILEFQELCDLAGIKHKADAETGQPKPWELKDLRKTFATYYDEHMPESSVEILGQSVGGITYRHYAHRICSRSKRL